MKEATQEFIRQAKELRAEADAAEEKFLAFLYDGEKKPDIWADTGLAYVQFIAQHSLCKAERYLGYKNARDTLGTKAIVGVGVAAVVAAGKLRDAKDQQEVIDRARKWEETNGTAISEQSAQRIASDAKIRGTTIRTGAKGYATLAKEAEQKQSRVEELEQQVAALKAENKQLRAKVKKLEKENASLRAPSKAEPEQKAA